MGAVKIQKAGKPGWQVHIQNSWANPRVLILNWIKRDNCTSFLGMHPPKVHGEERDYLYLAKVGSKWTRLGNACCGASPRPILFQPMELLGWKERGRRKRERKSLLNHHLCSSLPGMSPKFSAIGHIVYGLKDATNHSGQPGSWLCLLTTTLLGHIDEGGHSAPVVPCCSVRMMEYTAKVAPNLDSVSTDGQFWRGKFGIADWDDDYNLYHFSGVNSENSIEA